MYSVKQNQLIMGALPLADVTVYYIDVRSVGKGYDEFYQQAKDMGANFVKGRVSGVTETDEGNLVLRYEDIENGGTLTETEHDMVVLAVGVQPNPEAAVCSRTAPSLSTTTTTSARPTKTSTPVAPTSPACSSPVRPPGPRTSPTRSSTRAPRSHRPPLTWSERK